MYLNTDTNTYQKCILNTDT